jgi:peptidase YpeB-like protein
LTGSGALRFYLNSGVVMKFHPLAFGVCLTVLACNRHSGAPIKEETGGLSDSASIDATTARATALGKVPGGRIVKEELEKENGRLVYSFDIKKGAETGVEEVQVDARDGSVVSVSHEDAAKEAAEARKEP